MNAKHLRDHWINAFEQKFHQPYKPDNIPKELTLLKKLKEKYSDYFVLFTIDAFMKVSPLSKASISYYASKSTFEGRFKPLINLINIIKYYYIILDFPVDIRKHIQELVDEYIIYTKALITYDSEKERKKEILKELEELEKTLCKKI
jgi:hypothetical protein